MPNPIEILLDPISLLFIGMYFFLFFIERIFPAREQLQVKNWVVKGMLFFFIYFYVSNYLPLFVDPHVEQWQLLNLREWPLWTQFIVGLLIYEFFTYVWHWAMHKSDLLWKVFHQMHHSAERVDIPGANYFSLNDMIGFTLIGTLTYALCIGIEPQVVTYNLITITFLALLQHANLKTPQWLGYIVQRPESHSVHHEKGVHHFNYSDLPIFDIIFGTFRNPKEFPEEAGFYQGASDRMFEMLTFQDVSVPSNKE